MDMVIVEDLFEDFGSLVTARDPNQCIADLPQKDVITLFERSGMVLFRGFDTKPQTLSKTTDLYTESYASDAQRRAARFDQQLIRNVDTGAHAVLLHSEASFTPAWPEIIWFLCVVPPQKGGATTACDGLRIWSGLSEKTRNFFMLNPIRYDLKIPIGRTMPGRGRRPWLFKTLGAGNATIDWDTGLVEMTQIRSAVTEGREKNTFCFANHLVVHLSSENQLVRRCLIDGSPIPADIMAEIQAVSEDLTQEIGWTSGDLAMIDNKRVMHGRRAYEPGDKRDIVIVQTARASFSYGATTRQGLSKAA